MAYQDFRDFLNTLKKEGQLLEVQEEVKPEPDLGAAARAANNLGFFNRRVFWKAEH